MLYQCGSLCTHAFSTISSFVSIKKHFAKAHANFLCQSTQFLPIIPQSLPIIPALFLLTYCSQNYALSKPNYTVYHIVYTGSILI